MSAPHHVVIGADGMRYAQPVLASKARHAARFLLVHAHAPATLAQRDRGRQPGAGSFCMQRRNLARVFAASGMCLIASHLACAVGIAMPLRRMLRVGTANNSWQAQLRSAASARAARGVAVNAMATQRAAIDRSCCGWRGQRIVIWRAVLCAADRLAAPPARQCKPSCKRRWYSRS
jgi:hypothetical protein